jgi:uncharacterized protein YceH (UPF0502 family)
MQRIPRRLEAVECRVLGALLEKEQATPEYYPMTLHALVAACNQKSNREPVLELSEAEVEAALRRLFEDVLVWRSEGARTLKWSHNLDRRWGLSAATRAVMTLLLLRGAQTAGELRGRSERLHAFATVAEVEAALADLAAGDPAAGDQPLVAELARAPGQKEPRWRHLVGEATVPDGAAGAEPAPAPGGGFEARLARLERRLARVERELGLTED